LHETLGYALYITFCIKQCGFQNDIVIKQWAMHSALNWIEYCKICSCY